MILETAIGGTLGGLLRLAPELLKFLDRKNERKHEIALLDKNIEADKLRGEQAERQLAMQNDLAQITHGLQALMEALRGQGQITGIKWVDALNQSVRPIITYGIAFPYVVGKTLVFAALTWAGFWKLGLDAGAVKEALAATYTAADMGLLSGILNFWFLGRVFDKRSA